MKRDFSLPICVDLRRRMDLLDGPKMKGACFQVPFIKYNKHLQDFYFVLVDSVLQLFAHFEKGQFFWFNLDFCSGFGISSRVGSVFFHHKAAESANFDAASFFQLIVEAFENQIDHVNGFFLRQIHLLA